MESNYEEVDVDKEPFSSISKVKVSPSKRKKIEDNSNVINVDEYRSNKVEDSLVTKPSKNHPLRMG